MKVYISMWCFTLFVASVCSALNKITQFSCLGKKLWIKKLNNIASISQSSLSILMLSSFIVYYIISYGNVSSLFEASSEPNYILKLKLHEKQEIFISISLLMMTVLCLYQCTLDMLIKLNKIYVNKNNAFALKNIPKVVLIIGILALEQVLDLLINS